MNEIRKDIPWYEWYYTASNTGSIKWIIKGKLVKQCIEKTGYPTVCLYKDKNNKHTKTVHRLIASSFIDNPSNLPQVNHKDWVKHNNNVNNLEWCSISDNLKHRYRTLWQIPRFKKDSSIKHPASWTPPEKFKRVKYVLQCDLQWKPIRERCWLRSLCRRLKLNRDTLKVKISNGEEYKWYHRSEICKIA